MTRIKFGFLFPVGATVLMLFALSTKLSSVPPLGKVLDPFVGFCQNGNDRDLDASFLNIHCGKSGNPVKVFFDARKVPHIYAATKEDMFFAQGYITAKLRLWQMDFLCYATAGRLSEIFEGKNYLNYDRSQRRLGLLDAAERSLRYIEENADTKRALSAYTNGINAYIDGLDYKHLPVEYKLLDYRPEHWSNLKSVLVLKQMGNMLAGYEEDVSMSKLMLLLGESEFNKLFPDYVFPITPVMDTDRPKSGEAGVAIRKPDYLTYSFIASGSVVSKSSYNPQLGSNSWAVSGKMTASGFPILANDPHLGLSLPCIWVEMQMTAPGINVYGVAIPGAPGIIIGYNNTIAWGITNGADDVRDWYKLEISPNYKRYKLDGKWVEFKCRVEEIKRRGQPSFYDTIYSSVHGPVVYDQRFPGDRPEYINYACRWELYQPSNEINTFLRLDEAKDIAEFRSAIRGYGCPSLNFVFACKDNTIAVFHQGRLVRKEPGQGKFIFDGTRTSEIPSGYIPFDSLPHLVDPPCNYVISANQHPTYPGYPYYYNGYYLETRANEIQTLLRGNVMNVEKTKAMQLNNTSSFAVGALPVLIRRVDTGRLSGHQKDMLLKIGSWNGSYDLNSEIAGLFSSWWDAITFSTWDEFRKYSFDLKTPDDMVLLELIQKEPENKYFDRLETSQKETAVDIVTDAFTAAVEGLDTMNKQGFVKWGDFHKVQLMHITQIPAFSILNISSAGNPGCINAISENWGPSWRMIVELGDRPRGYGVYPGGQSGDPGSHYYGDFVPDWNKGNYYPLAFFESAAEAAAKCSTVWVLN